jgi:hypothetical protein
MSEKEWDGIYGDITRLIRKTVKPQKESQRTLVDGLHNEHYGEMELEPLDVAESWLTDEQLKGAYLFQLIKYLGRYNMAKEGKGGVADLKKMADYLGRLIELNQ